MSTFTVEDGCMIEFVILTLDGKRIAVRGVVEGLIRLRSVVLQVSRAPAAEASAPRLALADDAVAGDFKP